MRLIRVAVRMVTRAPTATMLSATLRVQMEVHVSYLVSVLAPLGIFLQHALPCALNVAYTGVCALV